MHKKRKPSRPMKVFAVPFNAFRIPFTERKMIYISPADKKRAEELEAIYKGRWVSRPSATTGMPTYYGMVCSIEYQAYRTKTRQAPQYLMVLNPIICEKETTSGIRYSRNNSIQLAYVHVNKLNELPELLDEDMVAMLTLMSPGLGD
jgi:hypothetical protein